VQPNVIAVYGTLRRGGQNHRLLDGAQFFGTGHIHGRLHVVGDAGHRPYAYPLLLPDDNECVVVELYRVTDAHMLRDLDRLEMYDPADEASSEYVRRSVSVFDHDTAQAPVRTAEAYFYNGSPTQIGEHINGGDWISVSGNSSAYPGG
jgi:gamma-glutamylcyclotransferase (GGCT)/AIG2-like uncharacterized protein YtfP